MPVTPFHFGPGALFHAIAPKHVSFLAFCIANILIDLESLYNLVHHNHPVHTFFHSYVGATLIVAAVAFLHIVARWFATRFWLPNLLHWRDLVTRQVIIGAALGAYSHVVLDSIMHQDIQPLSPFSASNHLLGLVSLSTLHSGCIIVGVSGLLITALRWFSATR